MANIDHPSPIAERSSDSEFSSVEEVDQFCYFLRTVLDKHASLLSGRLSLTTPLHALSQQDMNFSQLREKDVKHRGNGGTQS